MANDGKIIIDTKLDTSGFEKDVENASKKAANDLGKGTEKAMKQAETSINNVGKAVKNIDFSTIDEQIKKVDHSIEKVNELIDKQKQKLEKLKVAFKDATDIKQKNDIEQQMLKAEKSIDKLGSRVDQFNKRKISLDSSKSAANGLDGEFRSASVSAVKSLDDIEKKAQVTGNGIRKNMGSLSIGEGIIKVGNNISSVGDKLTMGVTLPLVGIGIAAAKVGMDFDSAMSRVKAISGATGTDFTKLKGQAIQLGSDTAFSAKEAAAGMEGLVSAGFSVNETMAAMPGMLDLAASSGESLASSADIAASTLRGFGLEASQAGHVADVLAKNAGATNAAVADTGEAMKYVAPAAHAAGLGLEEVTAAIGIMANSGIKGSQAGTTLRSALTRLASPAKEAADKMKEINFSGFDDKGKMKSLSGIIDNLTKSLKGKTDQQKQDYIATIFGQEAMSGMLTLIDSGSNGLDDLTASYKASDGAAKDMATTMQDNAKSAIEQMTGSLETAAIKLEEVAAPAITSIANKVQELANEFAELSPETQENIIEFALMAAAAGPVVKTIGGITSVIGGLIKYGSKLGSMLGILGTGAEAGEVALGGLSVAGGLAVGAAAALTVGIAGAVTYNELLGRSCATSADDLTGWEKAVNACTGSTIKSKVELQKAGLVYKDFGEGVSKEFKSGIEEATKSYHDFEMELTKDNMGDKISIDDQGKLTDSINKMIDGAKSAINKRKGEIQGELSKVFTADGSGINESEQKVLDISTKGADEKLAKITEIQGKISEVWTKAIEQHGKLSEEDITTIKNYLVQVQQIKAEVEAKNDAESSFAKNNFAERLNGISAEDARKEYSEASKTVKDNFVKLKATYKTGIDDLNDMQKKAKDDLSKAQTDDDKKKAQDDITAIQKQIEEKTQAYKEATGKEQSQIREYLDMLYKKNPSLEGKLNEVTGELFSSKDLNTQGNLYKIKQQYDEVASATESGIKRVQDASGKWHDIYVTVDDATGRITSAYDTFTGDFGGYSKKFADDAKSSGDKVKQSIEELQKSLTFNGGGIKLDSDNNAINATTDQLITKLDTVIKKADGAKTAVQDINGTKVRLEFDKDGTLTNAQDVEDAINGKLADNPAVVKTKIEVDGSQVSTIDDTIKKLQELPPETKTDITINGEEAQTTAADAIKKLQEIPPDTNTDVVVNTDDADNKLDTTKEKADEVDAEQPNVDATANTSEADNNLDNTKEKAEEVGQENPEVTVTANTSEAESGLSGIINNLKYIAEHPVTAFVNFFGNGVGNAPPTQEKYTGTNYLRTGLSHVNEHGYETANNGNVKMLDSGLAFLIGHHYQGGDGINDHMTTVNEMHNDISNQVGNTFGKIASTLINALSGQGSLLKQITTNTAQTVATGEKGNKLNEDLAKNIVSQYKSSSTGTFGNLENEITNANSAKEKADKMKVEDNSNYARVKQQVDDYESQIDELKTKADETTSEGYKKELEAQEKVLQKKKESASKEMELAKEVADNEIDAAKKSAEQQVKIAEEKKSKLVKLSEAVTTAIKNQLEHEKKSAEDSLNNDLKSMETSYNKSVKSLEDKYKSKSDAIDKKIKALEEETTDNSRDDERSEANNSISALETKIANTADEADKRKFQLELEKARKELNKKESSWDIEDKKAELEAEKENLSEKETADKESLERSYNSKKEAKEKELQDTDKYYDKLLEEDSVNAQARYMLLQGNQEELVALLQSYNPLWQDAGQSLADSLLEGLNSQKESIQNAVSEMLDLKGSSNLPPPTIGKLEVGYASGTNYNPAEGLYYTNEDGPEMSTNGDVAYVGKGASIKNRMQTDKFISSEIASQVALMKSAVIQSQMDTARSLGSLISKTTNTNNNISKVYQPILQIKEYHQHTNQDAEQLANEFGVIAYKQKVD